jgi:hypothetical protein
MDVVRHQTVSRDLKPELHPILPQQLQVNTPVIVHKKHGLPIITALRGVMRHPRNHYPPNSQHPGILPPPALNAK